MNYSQETGNDRNAQNNLQEKALCHIGKVTRQRLLVEAELLFDDKRRIESERQVNQLTNDSVNAEKRQRSRNLVTKTNIALEKYK